MKRLIAVITFLLVTLSLAAAERSLPKEPDMIKVPIRFNKDYLKGLYLYVDARTAEEKERNRAEKRLDGPVIVFFHGHNQRPNDGFNFTAELARSSKSGIVVVPVTDTPYGKKSKWRGDRGKDAILMAFVQDILGQHEIAVRAVKPITEMKVKIGGKKKKKLPSPIIETELISLGWSHGSLLARRFASAYPESVISLAQMAPAGFSDWGGYSCVGPTCLMTNFGIEGANIGLGIFRCEGRHIFDASGGIIKGQVADTARSCPSCIYGNFHVGKLFRTLKDTAECSIQATDKNFPVSAVKHIVVIFGDDDSLFEYDDDGGIKEPKKVTLQEKEKFFAKFYPGAVTAGSDLNLHVLKGNHIGPLVNHKIWVKTVLQGIDQMRPMPPAEKKEEKKPVQDKEKK